MGSMQGPLMLSYSKHSGVNLWPSQFLLFYWNSWPWHCNCLSTSNSLPINLLNMNISDPRFAMGAAATIHVTSVFKCHCRYGSLAKTKLANGTVPAVETLISAANNTVLRDHDHSQLHPWWELLHGCYLKFKVFQGWSCCSYPQWGQWTHDWIWDSNLKELNKNSKWWWNCFWGNKSMCKRLEVWMGIFCNWSGFMLQNWWRMWTLLVTTMMKLQTKMARCMRYKDIKAGGVSPWLVWDK